MIRNFLLLISFLFANLICAQFAANVDNTFNINNIINPSGGLATTQNDFGVAYPHSVFLQSNGKVIVSRRLSPYNFRYNEFHDLKILRLNTDGSVDQSFHQNFAIFSSISVTKIIEYNNKLIMIGSFTFTDVNLQNRKILVFNEDGTLDQNFVSPDIPNAISDVEVLSNGKIIISGLISYDINSQLVNGIVKLNLNGSIDSSFSVGSGFNQAIYCLEVQSDDKIIVGGNFTTFNGQTFNRLLRLNSDGSLDTSFNIGTGCNNIVYDIEIDNNGLILVGGSFTSYNSITTNNLKLIRLTNTGSRDLAFAVESTTFISSVNYIRKILCQSNGDLNILYSTDSSSVSDFNQSSKGLFYLTNTGATNTTKVSPETLKINNIALDSNNNTIYLVGSFDYLRVAANTYKQINHIAKIDSNGALTNDFNRKMLGFNYYALVNAIEQQTDGKLLIGGDYFQFYNENDVKNLVRLNLNGTIDTSFNVGDFSGFVYVIKQLQDGKILVGGKFTITSNSVVYKDLVRLNSDGSVDPTFVHSINFTNQIITALDIQSTNNLLIGVSYKSLSSSGSSGQGKIIRILPNGQNDSTFSQITVSTNSITKIKVLPNDKFLYSCGYIEYILSNLSYENGGMFKRDANGVSDSTFTNPIFTYNTFTSTHNESVYDFDITEDNKIIAIGGFGKVNSIVSNKVIRLSENGIVDNTFSVGTGFNGAPYTLKCLSGGKVLIGGNFLSYNNLNSKGLLRLNQDGSLDYSFNVGKGFSNKGVNKIFIQADNKILLGGFQFSYYNNYVASGLIRLIGGGNYSVTGSTKLDLNSNGCDLNDVVFPNMKFNIDNGTENFDFFADYSGNYKLDLNAGNYTISPIVSSVFAVTPPSISVQFPTQNTYFNQNYCVSPINGLVNDLNIIIIPLNNAVPGSLARYKIVFKNEGTLPRNGEIILNFNGDLMSFSSTNLLQTTLLPNQIKWNFANLLQQEQRTIDVKFLLNTPTDNPPLNSNDVLTFGSNITNDVDLTPNNNVFNLNQLVVNSYDPNDKTCLEGSVVGPEKIGDYVNYLIRFENTGTFPAQTIRVLDYIDTNKFDISTLKPVNSSHPMVVKISEVNKVEFIFNGINLPFDDANNDGYFVYQIKLKNNLNIGDTFSNTASIFFDYNYPIITNTSTSTITVLSLESTDGLSDINLFPNPTNDYINISGFNNNLINSIEVFNISGQKIKISEVKNNSIDLSDFMSGIYFIKIKTENSTKTYKILKN